MQLADSELGFDAAVDYKDGAVFKALRAAAPKGIDVYFDNVGGDILEACLAQMNNRGRIACCGAISQYDGVPSAHGPRGVPGLIVVKRLIMQGFIVMDFMDQRDEALSDLQSWVASGKLKVQEDVINGLENTPKALIGLLAGENRGKRMIKVLAQRGRARTRDWQRRLRRADRLRPTDCRLVATPRGTAADDRRSGMVIGVRAAGSPDAGRRGAALIEIRKVAMQRPAVVPAGHADGIVRCRRRHGSENEYRRGKCCKTEKMPAHLVSPF